LPHEKVLGCPADDFAQVGWIVASFFALIATSVSIWLIIKVSRSPLFFGLPLTRLPNLAPYLVHRGIY